MPPKKQNPLKRRSKSLNPDEPGPSGTRRVDAQPARLSKRKKPSSTEEFDKVSLGLS